MSERLNIIVEDGTKEKLLAMASERKQGELVSALIAQEYTRQTVTLEALSERVSELEESISMLPDLEKLEEKLTDLQPKLDRFEESISELPDLERLEELLRDLPDLSE